MIVTENYGRRILHVFLLWSGIFILTRVFFLYYPYHGEPDIQRMATGLYYNVLNGQGVFGDFLYGKPFSFGFYFIVFQILRLFPVFLNDLELLFMIMTWLSSFTIILFAILLFSSLSVSWLHLNVFLGLLLLSPVWWECTTYAHPVIAGTALLLIGAVCLRRACDSSSWKQAVIYFLCCSLTLFVSLAVRGEVILVIPGVFLLCATLRRGWLRVGAFVSVLVSVAGFFICQHLLLASHHTYVASKIQWPSLAVLVNFITSYTVFTDIPKGVAGVVAAFGIVSMVSIPMGIYYALKKKYNLPLISQL